MYAIIETGGKQYRVQEGDVLLLDRLAREENETVVFDRVLAVKQGEEFRVGTPTLEGARVTGRVLGHGRSRKIIVFKYRPKVNYRRKRGHRQPFTRVKIERIEV
ncbi:MAG: 50S ribosomal protein L21 [Symbiobacteriaceae bacterium]|nr:MAG: 50S ribosomal protein L21 [Bacillota bacterium]